MWPPSSTDLIADSQLPSALLIPDGPRAQARRHGTEALVDEEPTAQPTLGACPVDDCLASLQRQPRSTEPGHSTLPSRHQLPKLPLLAGTTLTTLIQRLAATWPNGAAY